MSGTKRPLILLAACMFFAANAQKLTVTPERALSDQPLSIVLSGLTPGSEATVRAQLTDDEGTVWSSRARFEAKNDGTVDVGAQAPFEGDYRGVDPMGLLWSMEPEREPAVGLFLRTSLEPLRIILTAEVAGETVARAEAERLAVLPDVARSEVRDEAFVGTLFVPPGEGPHPAVVVLGGSEGGLDEGTAALLASHGHVALALAYFGLEGLPQELTEIPLETFYSALEWLAAHDAVDAGRIALFGASKGAEAALLVASRRTEVRAVVAYAPSDVVWQGISFDPTVAARSSWSEGGEGLPFVPYVFNEATFAGMQPGDAVTLEPMYRASLDAYEGEAALIDVGRIQGPVLFISGGDDALWPGSLMAERALERLAGHGYEAEHLVFAEAGHLILAPYAPTYGTGSALGLKMGGGPEANAAAAARAWQRTLAFLGASLR